MDRLSSYFCFFTLILLFSFSYILAEITSTNSPADVGAWEGPYVWPIVAIHACVLHTGKVLHYSTPSGGTGSRAWLWDYKTGTMENVSTNRNLFCSGHSFLLNGDVLITGGTLRSTPSFAGLKDVHIFHTVSQTWERIDSMQHGRWYPTNLTLSDGTIMVFGGLNEDGQTNPQIEHYDPSQTPVWSLVDSQFFPLYPSFHLLSNGKLFYSSPSKTAKIFDPVSATWENSYSNNYGGRFNGTSVLLPGFQDRVMIIGGQISGDSLPTNTVEVIDLSDPPNAHWNYTSPMSYSRQHANAVILPDATVLMIGGRSDPDIEGDTVVMPVYVPELHDPQTETWTQMAAMTRPRMYHSTSVLLPDARVLAAGSNGEFNAEIFSPPYLFKGTRAVIQSADSLVGYGNNFMISFSSQNGLGKVVLMAPSAVTHSTNMSQRYVELSFQFLENDSTQIIATAPATPELAPPGYYMLFVLDSLKVPSEASFIHLHQCLTKAGDVTGDGKADLTDLIYEVNYVFKGGPAPVPTCSGDDSGNGEINVSDIVYKVNYIFKGGPAPLSSQECCL